MDPSAISGAAALIADTARSVMLVALARDERLAAKDLAREAGVSASTASAHLGKLMAGGLVSGERSGRIRYYRLANPSVGRALGSLSGLGRGRTEPGAVMPADDRRARTCFDHLAGCLGVSLMDSMLQRRLISRRTPNIRPARGGSFGVTKAGVDFLRSFGVDPRAVRARPRSYAHACLDRTERRPHLAGALGAAIADRAFQLGWIERTKGSRTVRITTVGRRGFREALGLEL